ncbi:YbaK/EbsC family protein [soil metagenome]
MLHPLVAEAVAELRIEGDVVPCDPDAADTADFCATYGYEMEDSANTIVVVGKAAEPVHAACVVLATTKLAVNSVVRKRLGTKKASFAPGEVTKELTDMEIGGVTAVGLPAGMPLWIDSAVMGRERIILGGGNRSSKLVVAPAELLKVPGVEVVDGLAAPVG